MVLLLNNKQNKLYRRDAIRGLRFRPSLSYEDDNFFACEVNAAIRRKVKLDAALYAYRDNPSSATSSIPFREYVRSTLERIRLSHEVFLVPGRVPASQVAEHRADLARDAYRMCIRKNLRKNRCAASRRELFLAAGDGHTAREPGYPVGLVGGVRTAVKHVLTQRMDVGDAMGLQHRQHLPRRDLQPALSRAVADDIIHIRRRDICPIGADLLPLKG